MVRWNHNLSYVIGLITTDGSLSKDGRHIILVSKDLEQINNVKRILVLSNKIGIKNGGFSTTKQYNYLQFGNIELYRFLSSIGLTPNKSKTLGALNIPAKYFADFLRGHLDGDGYTYSYWDKRWRSSFRMYTAFLSASKNHITWLKERILTLYNLEGKITFQNRKIYRLEFAKRASVKLLSQIYYNADVICLKRKLLKITQALGIIHKEKRFV